MPDREVQRQMRDDWDRRAREDARKRRAGWRRSLEPVPGARLLRVTNTRTNDPVAPAGGRFSRALLWLENLTEDADINNLEVEIAGSRVAPSYIGNYDRKSPTQVNCFLPLHVPTGLLQTRVWMLGQPISNFARPRVISTPPAVARLISVTDGINLLSGARLETRSLKVNVEEVECASAAAFRADIDGVPLEDLDLSCADPARDTAWSA